jgi:hypothetical protein
VHNCIKLVISFLIFSAFEVSADEINLNKDVRYKDGCYRLEKSNGFSQEGYWRDNKLWDGVYTNTILNEITFKYFGGIEVYLGPECQMNIQGWYVCRGGDKYKPINGGTITKDMELQGQFIYKFANGDVYEGNLDKGQIHGYGKFTWASGDVYEGNYKNDARHGYGKKTWSDGDVYEGNYKNNARHGYGKKTWSDGDVYEGNWDKDQIHGYGKMTWSSGETSEGQWRNGKMVN